MARQLFLDLDGVFADFDTFVEETLGIKVDRKNEPKDFWNRLRTYPGRLYYEMKPFPYASSLFESLRLYKPIILTGCPRSIPSADFDKRQWVKEHLDPDVPVITCRSWEKHKYASSGDVLLDDWPKYQDLWERVGGIFIRHVEPETSIRLVREIMDA